MDRDEHFTEENVDELLDAAALKSKLAVQELIARRAPRPDVPARIRKLPDRAPPEGASALGLALTVAPVAEGGRRHLVPA